MTKSYNLAVDNVDAALYCVAIHDNSSRRKHVLAEHYHEIDSESGTTNDVVPWRVYHGCCGRSPYHIPQSQLEALIVTYV